jgi:hypothetical protein
MISDLDAASAQKLSWYPESELSDTSRRSHDSTSSPSGQENGLILSPSKDATRVTER